MELVEGDTLADRLLRGPIPVDEALPLFVHIAEGLEAAHEKGIVHRDLKPANIKITKEGKPKILDFGLAKALAGEPVVQDLSQSPTLTRDATETGVLLGTAPYMSPEQARGKPVDKRTDIWAFGCCLYEALTGRATFLGATVSDTLAAVLKTEPDWNALPTTTPTLIRSLLRRCLQKDATRRVRDITDARIEIEEVEVEPVTVDEMAIETRGPRSRYAWGSLVVLTALAAGTAVWFLRPQELRPVTRVLVGVEPGEYLGQPPSTTKGRGLDRTAVVFSPDGDYLVYAAVDGEQFRLYQRRMDEDRASPIPGTEGAVGPFLSPDGQWVGFWADGKLKKVSLAGGTPVTLTDFPDPPFGASWGADGSIFLGRARGGLLRISDEGGQAEVLTTLSEGEMGHRLPHALPDGDAVLFTIVREGRNWEGARVAVQALLSGERKMLIDNGADARHAATGHLVFVRMGTLMAVPFDREHLKLTGGTVDLIDGISQSLNNPNAMYDTGAGQFSFSSSGALAFVPGGIWPDVGDIIIWVNRQGLAEPIPVPPGRYTYPRLSPDGHQVAVAKTGLSPDIWIYDLSRGTFTRLTVAKGFDGRSLWTPDGKQITFQSEGSGPGIYSVAADGSGKVTRLTTVEGVVGPSSWSPDGRALAFVCRKGSRMDIWMLAPNGGARPFIESEFDERWPTFSPDGRWLAYASDQSGRHEVYVTPYPGPGPRIQVSTGGGQSPAWAPNGRELFYRNINDSEGLSSMMAVPLETQPTFKAGRPRELFRGSSREYNSAVAIRDYDVSADGQKFLMVRTVGQKVDPVTEIHVVLNWFEELKRLVPTEN